ncbi:hypothetical protein HHK36_024909 [Tetracentron sinense]|uniref:Secreted protein n=1 Tax=Tetracentron sinense TaxID=13715 RepID=A0A834YPX2_TETSI|nr:hypothetical protein HHK36_024909 [Tetracentron sinense]
MNVVNLVILLGNVAYALVQEAWEVEGVEAPVLGAEEAQVMVAGATALGGGDLHLHNAAAYRLVEAVATAGHRHIAMLILNHHMLMVINAGAEAEAEADCCQGVRSLQNVVLIGLISTQESCYLCAVLLKRHHFATYGSAKTAPFRHLRFC